MNNLLAHSFFNALPTAVPTPSTSTSTPVTMAPGASTVNMRPVTTIDTDGSRVFNVRDLSAIDNIGDATLNHTSPRGIQSDEYWVTADDEYFRLNAEEAYLTGLGYDEDSDDECLEQLNVALGDLLDDDSDTDVDLDDLDETEEDPAGDGDLYGYEADYDVDYDEALLLDTQFVEPTARERSDAFRYWLSRQTICFQGCCANNEADLVEECQCAHPEICIHQRYQHFLVCWESSLDYQAKQTLEQRWRIRSGEHLWHDAYLEDWMDEYTQQVESGFIETEVTQGPFGEQAIIGGLGREISLMIDCLISDDPLSGLDSRLELQSLQNFMDQYFGLYLDGQRNRFLICFEQVTLRFSQFLPMLYYLARSVAVIALLQQTATIIQKRQKLGH